MCPSVYVSLLMTPVCVSLCVNGHEPGFAFAFALYEMILKYTVERVSNYSLKILLKTVGHISSSENPPTESYIENAS